MRSRTAVAVVVAGVVALIVPQNGSAQVDTISRAIVNFGGARPGARGPSPVGPADVESEPSGDFAGWVRQVNAAVAEAERAGSGSWFSCSSACINAAGRVAQASLRVQNLTLGTRRPGFVPAEGGSQAWQELRERIEEARQRASAACGSIEPPRLSSSAEPVNRLDPLTSRSSDVKSASRSSGRAQRRRPSRRRPMAGRWRSKPPAPRCAAATRPATGCGPVDFRECVAAIRNLAGPIPHGLPGADGDRRSGRGGPPGHPDEGAAQEALRQAEEHRHHGTATQSRRGDRRGSAR